MHPKTPVESIIWIFILQGRPKAGEEFTRSCRTTPAMTNDRFLAFAFPAVASKKITAAFDGGRMTSDGGVMVLAQAERRLAIAEKLAAVIADPRDRLA